MKPGWKSLVAAALLASAQTVAIQPATAQGVAVATQAQVGQIDKRVNVLERQMRAVQRQVFPGDRKYFEPEVVPPAASTTDAAGAAGSNPVVELTQRVVALETRQRELTGQIEQLQHQMRQLQAAQDKFRGDAEFRLDTLEGKTPAQPGAQPGAAASAANVETPPASEPAPDAAAQVAAPAPAAPAPEPAAPADPEKVYVAGYEKYVAKDYDGAIRDLEAFLAAHPKHARASNAQFWAGRSMAAKGQHAQAAKAFLAGYQNYPRGQRAHNSLLWLGKSLISMQQPQAACQALDQLATAYPDRITGSFATDVAATRKQAKCA